MARELSALKTQCERIEDRPEDSRRNVLVFHNFFAQCIGFRFRGKADTIENVLTAKKSYDVLFADDEFYREFVCSYVSSYKPFCLFYYLSWVECVFIMARSKKRSLTNGKSSFFRYRIMYGIGSRARIFDVRHNFACMKYFKCFPL